MFLKFMKKCSYNVPKSAQNRVVLGALFLMIPFIKIKRSTISDKKDQKCSYSHYRNVPMMFLSALKNKSKILLDFIK